MKVFFVFFLVLVFGVVSSHGRTHEYNAPTPFKTSTTIEYDEFFLVQQWPASYCHSPLKCQCRPWKYIPTYFTVHGLWAQWNGSAANCEGGKRFNPSCQLNPKTESNLKTYWPNLNGKDQEFWRRELFNWPLKLNPETEANLKKYWPNLNGNDRWFWESEYKRHASCISPFQKNKEKYFSSTLELAKKYNVTTILSKADIYPGMDYLISDIKKAIYSAIKVTPILQCNRANDGTFQLYQIYLCIDTTASKLQHCQTKLQDRGCGSQSTILFPDHPKCPSQSLLVLSSTGKWTMN